MNMIVRLFLFLLLLNFGLPVQSEDIPLEFPQAEQQQRYQDLIEEIRCLVCQNQSLADSTADLAQDLRKEIFQMIVAGKDNQAIIDFLVNRYGDFVLYRPPLKQSTWLLWFTPFVLLIIAVVVVVYFVRGRSIVMTEELSEEDNTRLASLLQEQGGDK